MTRWEEINSDGKRVFKNLDDHQRVARDHDRPQLPRSVTRKMIDKIVKPAKMDKK